jgi:S-adenosylmethionine hydrolase
MSPRPVIALLSDFGLSDHYVGVMKGVIAGICPAVLLIDITHDVPRQDIRAAAFELAAAWQFFPPQTIFVAVVDPGVGTARRAVAARVGPYSFVAPDNGVLDLVLAEQPAAQTAELTNPRYARHLVSDTFHGRDRFAPAAAWLAQGTPIEALGDAVDLRTRLSWSAPDVAPTEVTGEVVHVDRFGNLITNVHRRLWPSVVDIAGVSVAGHPPVRMVRTYGEAAPGETVALFSSSDRLEVAVTQGSAAERLGAGRGAVVQVFRRA